MNALRTVLILALFALATRCGDARDPIVPDAPSNAKPAWAGGGGDKGCNPAQQRKGECEPEPDPDPEPEPPADDAPPTDLSGVERAGPAVDLTWTNQAVGYSHLIYRSADGSGFVEWGEVEPGVEAVGDETVTDDTRYRFYLRAYDGARGETSDTITVEVGTP